MSKEYPLPIVIDSTVIFNFGVIGQFELLEKLYKNQLVIPTDVKVEVVIDRIAGPIVEEKIKNQIIREYLIKYDCENEEIKDYIRLRRKFGLGESACLAIAKNSSCTVATDDMRVARKYCEDNNISLIGTLGILYKAYENGLISADDGQAILSDMINIRKYKSPTASFSDVIAWFEEGRGKKIY